MKKKIALGLALALAASVGTTAFAAAVNPFTDVPAKHWAYNAVQQLAKAGVIEGYNDGQFKGDRTITRYEMAVIIAKAMAREDRADASQKAMIDKLAAEFSTELANLGVRVSKLEKDTATPYGPSAKVYGDARVRYQRNPNIGSNNAVIPANSKVQERVRLNFDDYLTDNVLFQSRFTYQSNINETGDTLPGGASNQSTGIVDYAYLQFKNILGQGNDFRIGRDSLMQAYGMIAGNTGGYDSARIILNSGKELKAWFAYGDIAPYIMYSSGGSQTTGQNINTNGQSTMNQYTGFATTPAVNITTGEITYSPNKDIQLMADIYWTGTHNYNYKVWSVGGKFNLTPNLYLAGDYAENTASGNIFLGNGYANPSATNTYGTKGVAAGLLPIDQKKAAFAQLGYTKGANNTNNGIDAANAGAWGLFLNYKHLGGQAIDYNNTSVIVFENISDPFLYYHGEKGWGLGAQYNIAHNVRFTGTWESMKALDSGVSRAKFTYARIEYMF